MTSRLFTLLLALCLALSLAACTRDGAPTSSAPVPETTKTAATSGSNVLANDFQSEEKEPPKTYFDGIKITQTFMSVEEYKNNLLTFTDVSALRWSFVVGGLGDSVAIRDEKDFAMLLEDDYFLLPVLESSYSVTKILFHRDGYTEFTVQTPSGERAMLTCRHNTEPYGKIENAERTTLLNARGMAVTREHPYTNNTNELSYVYTWVEGVYACRLSCAENADEFVKELSFEKVSLDA